MKATQMNHGKDLTKEPPRSSHERLGGLVILPRTIDKCRALLWGNIGEYHFNCPLDNVIFHWKGIKGDDFKKFVETGASDEEIVLWVKENGMPKTDAEIAEWAKTAEDDDYSSKPLDKKQWLQESAAKVGLPKTATLFDYLDADDKASFTKKPDSTVCEI